MIDLLLEIARAGCAFTGGIDGAMYFDSRGYPTPPIECAMRATGARYPGILIISGELLSTVRSQVEELPGHPGVWIIRERTNCIDCDGSFQGAGW